MAVEMGTRKWGRLLRVGGLGLVFVAAFAAVYVFTVRTLQGRVLSDASLRGALSTNGLLSRVVAPVLSVVSVASLLAAVAVIALLALARSVRESGMVAVGLLIASNVSTFVLKRYVLSRPDFGLKEVAPSTLNSLPSGHATAAMAVVVALLFVLPAVLRWPTAAIGAGYATFTGVATMSAGWHRAGDCLAAYLLVGFWAAVAGVVLLVRADGSVDPLARAVRSRLARWWLVSSVGALGLGVGIAGVLAGVDPLRDSVVGPPIVFVAAGFLIVGTGSAVLIGVLWILELCQPPARPTVGTTGTDR